MRFYSDLTKRFYDTADDCAVAEKEYQNKLSEKEEREKKIKEERASRAKEVEKAYKILVDARKDYNKKLNDFCKDYGSYHFSITGKETDPFNLFARFFEI